MIGVEMLRFSVQGENFRKSWRGVAVFCKDCAEATQTASGRLGHDPASL